MAKFWFILSVVGMKLIGNPFYKKETSSHYEAYVMKFRDIKTEAVYRLDDVVWNSEKFDVNYIFYDFFVFRSKHFLGVI